MALFGRLVERIEQRASTTVSHALDAVEAAVAEFPGINVRRDDDRLIVSGRGLVRRWLDDARVRFALRGLR